MTSKNILKKYIKELLFEWELADDKNLMLDQEGMEKSDRENVSRYLKSLGLLEADKRKPRKKGQHKGSSKHSDLFTNENPERDIKGLGFKDAATARKGVTIVNKAKRTHAHKVQATLVMVQRGKEVIKRTKDPDKKRDLKAANKIWSAHLEKLKKKTKEKNK